VLSALRSERLTDEFFIGTEKEDYSDVVSYLTKPTGEKVLDETMTGRYIQKYSFLPHHLVLSAE
jgi:hypothetical protein